MSSVTIVIVSARQAFIDRICLALLQQLECRLAGVAGTAAQGLEKAKLLHPDVVLWDVECAANRTGRYVWPVLNASLPGSRVILCRDTCDDRSVAQAVELGAWGFVLRDRPIEEFLKAARAVHNGELWICRKAMSLAFQSVRGVLCPAPTQDGEQSLSEREQEIVFWLSRGLRNKEIARTLGISDKTVKSHMQHIFKKLNLHRRAHIAVGHTGEDQHYREAAYGWRIRNHAVTGV